MTKAALDRAESLACEKVARELGGDHYKAWMVMRYTGCHPRVLFPYGYYDKDKPFKEYGMKESVDEKGLLILEWSRPKKKGAIAFTSVPKMPCIDFCVKEWGDAIRARSSKYKKSTKYAQDLLREIGKKAGLEHKKITPMTLRHTLCVDLALSGVHSSVIIDTYNISSETLRTYVKMKDTLRNRLVYNALNNLYGTDRTGPLSSPASSEPRIPEPRPRREITHNPEPMPEPQPEPPAPAVRIQPAPQPTAPEPEAIPEPPAPAPATDPQPGPAPEPQEEGGWGWLIEQDDAKGKNTGKEPDKEG